jgi:SAM-dependent methyltransferase
MHNVPGTYTVERCDSCGLIFLNPQPDADELSKHYPQDQYYPHRFSGFKSWLYAVLYTQQFLVSRKLLSPLKWIMRSVKITPGGNYLDVGCGSGAFMRIIESAGMNAFGVEPVKIGRNHGTQKGLNIFHGFLEEAKYPDGFFGLITLNHVLEHISNPMTTLNELKRILKPKGTLIIGVPQSESLAYRLFKKNWIQLDVPRHLYTFSCSTLKRYAEVTGFKIDKTRFNSKPLQIYGSLFYLYAEISKKNMFFAESRLLKSQCTKVLVNLFIFPLALILNLFHLGDELEFILTK